MKICGIYKITSPSGKIYIGQSVDIVSRWNAYKKLQNCKWQTKLFHSFNKYGTENHNFEILCQCGKEELNNLEIYYIELYKTFNSKNGLNLKSGGSNGTASEETRQRLIKSHKGQKAWNKGGSVNKKIRLKISNSKKGVPAWNKGKAMPEQVKINMGKAQKERFKKNTPWNKGKKGISQKTRNNMSLAHKGKKYSPRKSKK